MCKENLDFRRKKSLTERTEKTLINDQNRYHSAYHTENPYYDGRNMILDGDYQGAIDILTADFFVCVECLKKMTR